MNCLNCNELITKTNKKIDEYTTQGNNEYLITHKTHLQYTTHNFDDYTLTKTYCKVCFHDVNLSLTNKAYIIIN